MEFNAFTAINKDWMLITAGDQNGLNMMTASWGSMGELWNHYTTTIHIRPQRYTRKFVEEQDFYAICFFDETYRDVLTLCGSKSGKDCDKIKESRLTPVFDQAAPYFQEAKLVLICRKLFHQEMTADCFLDKALMEKCYPEKDFHHSYVGGIVKVLCNDGYED